MAGCRLMQSGYAARASQGCDRQPPTHNGHPIVLIPDIRFIIATMIELSAAMNQDRIPLQPSALRATVAYLLSVTAATTYIVASGLPHVIEQRASSGLLPFDRKHICGGRRPRWSDVLGRSGSPFLPQVCLTLAWRISPSHFLTCRNPVRCRAGLVARY